MDRTVEYMELMDRIQRTARDRDAERPIDEDHLVALIARAHGNAYGSQAQADLQALVNEVVRLRGLLYDAKTIRVELQSQVLRLAELLVGEGGTQD